MQDAYWKCDQKMHPQLRPSTRHNPREEGEEKHRNDQLVIGTHLDDHLGSPVYRQIAQDIYSNGLHS